ncbi:hypothetical protein BC941DRAFT_453983 [Chlamydoabsidia padenii]|nr:hypothetical protein BC941DRAFT_453983 [Chlamydoabsidia padenii]
MTTSRPWGGDMGFGRFVIRGSRRQANGDITPFAYAWRRSDPSSLSRASAWLGYVIHQLGQWYIITRVLQQQPPPLTYATTWRWWNWAMVYLNISMAFYKLIQAHLFYDGLAVDISEAITQGSVIMILVVALILAIPRRGIIFGYPQEPIGSVAYNVVWNFIKKYHAYMISFGTVMNFHYHPCEGTLAHHHGFIYQCLLLWQSSNFLHTSHRNKYWVLFLELWVLVHGSFTAYFQPGPGWQIFLYGFLVVFVTNQIYDTGLLNRHASFTTGWRPFMVYLSFILLVLFGFGKDDHHYYRILFIPVAEFLAVLYCLGIGGVGYYWIQRYPSHRIIVAGLAYILAGAGVILSLAYILAGHLKVFDDY